jgi:hypothetical protein
LDSKGRKESTGQQRIFFLRFRSERERVHRRGRERKREGKGEHVAAGERKRERGGGREKK